jgi:hypothetical protein
MAHTLQSKYKVTAILLRIAALVEDPAFWAGRSGLSALRSVLAALREEEGRRP